jgi:hypothetical protein
MAWPAIVLIRSGLIPELRWRKIEISAAVSVRRTADSRVAQRAQGALWQAVMLGFVGLDLRGDKLGIDPGLPAQWRGMIQLGLLQSGSGSSQRPNEWRPL